MEIRFFIALLVLCCLSVSPVSAQRCAGDFSAIDRNCIQANESKFGKQSVVLSSSLVDNVYFYKTNLGNLGKLQIVSVVTDNERSVADKKRGLKECVVYFTATTYSDSSTFQPNSILSIRSEYNNWSQDGLGLDRNGPYDLRLERSGEKCVIKPISATWMSHKKISSTEGLFGDAGSQTLYYAGLVLIGLAVFLVARSTLDEESKFKAGEALEEADNEKKSQITDIVLRFSRPFFKRYFTPIVMSMKGRQGLKASYRRKLANAGLTKELTPEDFFAFKLFLIIGFPVLFIVIRILLEEAWSLSLVPLLGFIGFYYPNIWLSGRIENRRDEMMRGMPFIVDMLALSVEAGLDFMAAIQKVIEKAPPSPLVEEFETMIKETKIGSSRAEGLRQMAWRIDVLPINSFCATLIAADSVGASIAPILKQLSNEMRQKRSSEAEKKGATAATKILFPMIIFIMPAVFIAIAGPMLMRFISGGT